MLDAGIIRLIDIRTDEEVAGGMIPGAEHIPMERFDASRINPDDPRIPVLYCRSGRRSAQAGAALSQATGLPTIHLGGGLLGWQTSGFAIE